MNTAVLSVMLVAEGLLVLSYALRIAPRDTSIAPADPSSVA